MKQPMRIMPASFRWLGTVVDFVRECGKGVIVRDGSGLEFLAWWEELEEV